MQPGAVKASRFLSFVLRHRPGAIGLELDAHGWANVEELIAAAVRHGETLSLALIREVVEQNDKKRFALSDDGQRIRAVQGHSVEVDLQLQPRTPPPQLFHGTATRFLDSILADGLRGGERQHVHLSADEETAMRVGARHGKPVVVPLDAAAMHDAGHLFYLSENGVWLTAAVPPRFLGIFREPWMTLLDLPPERRQAYVDEVLREIRPSHPLLGKRVEAIARRQDRDDVLFRFTGQTEGYAAVHLTWRGGMEQHGWPRTELFATLEEFFRLRADPEVEEWIALGG